MASTCVSMNNGCKIPIVGLGTYLSEPGEVAEAVKCAIDAGYRHIDCALLYGNEVEVGQGIREKIEDGTVKREDLFITSKLWNTFHSRPLVVPSCKQSLSNLGLSYLDLYLVHWPMGQKEGEDLWPSEYSDVDYLETWTGMEDCHSQGLAKSIGVSNFNSEQLTRLLESAQVKPAVNQVEVQPLANNKKLIEFCKKKDVHVTGYCPLGRPGRGKSGGELMRNGKIADIGKKYGKSCAQVVLRYLISLGISVVPKSVTAKRIKENIDVFDFELNADEIAYMDSLHKNQRVCLLDFLSDHKYYPFHSEF